MAYMNEMHSHWTEYWATWLPERRIRIGDCGPLIKGVRFDNPYNLEKDFGIKIETEPVGRLA
jgi:hypothetical protein